MEAPTVVTGWGPRWLRLALLAPATVFLVLLAFGNSPLSLTDQLPGVPRFFLQCACLFPDAARYDIEYRVEAWSCDLQRFVELDHRVYFPLRADDKESRFARVGQFYRSNQRVMHALEDYLVEHHNTRAAYGAAADDVDGRIGGILFLSLRVPLPAAGTPVARYRYRALDEFPRDERKTWYITSATARQARCNATDGAR